MSWPVLDPGHYARHVRRPVVRSDPAFGAFTRWRPFSVAVTAHPVGWPALTQSEKGLVDAAWATTKGPTLPTAFTPPGAVDPVDVRFEVAQLRTRKISGNTWALGPVTLVEEPTG